VSLLRWIELMHSRLKLDIGWGDLLWAAMGAPVSRDDTRVAEAVVEKYFAPGRVVIGLSVRTVFDALLSEVGPPPQSSVLMSGINIQNMADIVRAHDLTIEAVDLDLATLAPEPDTLLNAQGRCGARLCVVTQLYGGVSEVWDAAELRKRGVLVVEDAAQAFSGDGYQGLSDADVTLFSFGPIKRRTALGGGVAVFRDPDLAARVRQRLETYDLLKERWFRARAVKYLILKLASTPWVYAGVIRAIAASGRDPDSVIGGAARGFGGQDLPEAIRKQPPRRLVSLMARRIAASPDPEFRRRIGRAFGRWLCSDLSVLAHARSRLRSGWGHRSPARRRFRRHARGDQSASARAGSNCNGEGSHRKRCLRTQSGRPFREGARQTPCRRLRSVGGGWERR
jgi:dTDP-4-amino-4,6-dideoxygalactose transaminase